MAVIKSLDDQTPLYLWPPNNANGPLTIDPFLRKALLDSVIDLVSFSNGVAMSGSTSHMMTIKLTGNLAYNGSGEFSGLSGIIESESVRDDSGPANYEMSGLNLSVYDYLNTSTWDSVLAGNDVVYGTSIRDEISSGAGFDTIFGGAGSDSILGGMNGDEIHGGADGDNIRGGNGHDKLFGDEGEDALYGAKGADTLTGGAGADRFIFSAPVDGQINVDTITDFEMGVDWIELSPNVFTALGRPQRTMSLNDRSADAGIGRLSYESATGKLSYDADGAGSAPAQVFAVIGVDSHPTSLASIYFFYGENFT